MSMIRCEDCERFVDSDDDPDCFEESGDVRCERCREKADHVLTPHELLEMKLDWLSREAADLPLESRLGFLISQLDELCAIANDAERAGMLDIHKIAVGQMASRSQLVLSLLAARQPAGLRLVGRS